jgi:hypothetical protein
MSNVEIKMTGDEKVSGSRFDDGLRRKSRIAAADAFPARKAIFDSPVILCALRGEL